jgi:hypothetical protein
METLLQKADKVAVMFERLADGKIRVTTSSWDDAKVILPNQVLEVAIVGGGQADRLLGHRRHGARWSGLRSAGVTRHSVTCVAVTA